MSNGYRTRGDGLFIPAAELAHSIGVRPESVKCWIDRRRNQGSRWYKKIGGRNYIRADMAEAYLSSLGVERLAKRPQGWVTVKALRLDMTADGCYIYGRIRKPDVRMVNVRNTLYLHPDDAAFIRREYASYQPLSGWALDVPLLASQLGLTEETTYRSLLELVKAGIVKRRGKGVKGDRKRYYLPVDQCELVNKVAA